MACVYSDQKSFGISILAKLWRKWNEIHVLYSQTHKLQWIHVELAVAELMHINAEMGLRTQCSNNKTIRQRLLIKFNEDAMSAPGTVP